jgi:tRNA(fMet)-specific endonuclease VapC
VIQFMLDTDICIYLIKRKPEKVINRLKKTPVAHIGISTITLSELEYGVMKSAKPEQNKVALAEFLAPIAIMSYDDYAAQHYGRIRAYLEKYGTPIGSLDMLIAAHARSLQCTLVTNNEAEFSRIPELKIDNWVR